MNSPLSPSGLSPGIERLLAALRGRIRLYVLLEGLAAAVIWLGLTFWAGLALDYFPILVGASELPRAARGVLLVLIAVVLAVIVYRLIVRRLLVTIGNRSAALVLERRFGEFHDSLLTAVEFGETPARGREYNAEMLASTGAAAEDRLPEVRLGRVFNQRRLWGLLLAAGGLAATVAFWGWRDPSSFRIWTERLYALSEAPWPRRSLIEAVKVRAVRSTARDQSSVDEQTFDNGRVKVAKGARVSLYVRAAAAEHYVPDICTIVYTTGEGTTGRVNMRKLGGVDPDHYQYYIYDGKPLDEIFSSVGFDVIGFDHRLRNLAIDVVASPAVVAAEVDCDYPAYLEDPKTNTYRHHQEPLAAGKKLPQGTQGELRLTSSKPLAAPPQVVEPVQGEKARAWDDKLVVLDPHDPTRFSVRFPPMEKNLVLDISLRDTDGIASEAAYRVSLQATPDEPPKIDVVLRGIGSAITPDARLPFRGTVIDDYAVADSWIDLALVDPATHLPDPSDPPAASSESGGAQADKSKPGAAQAGGAVRPAGREPLLEEAAEELLESVIGVIRAQKFPFTVKPQGKMEAAVDLREERSAARRGIELKPKDKIAIFVRATDRCTLAGSPNLGSSRRTELEVVTPAELLALLEEREVRFRRQFEQVIEEMTAARDVLARLKLGERPAPAATEGGSPAPSKDAPGKDGPPVDPAAAAERLRDFRLHSVQQSRQQGSKSQQEVLGLAQQFEDIAEELVNNRVDTEDRRKQLAERIALPLRRIGSERFPELEKLLSNLETKLSQPPQAAPLAQQSVEKATQILQEMEDVLKQMLEVESYNQLVELVREMIKEQDALKQETNKLNVEKLLK